MAIKGKSTKKEPAKAVIPVQMILGSGDASQTHPDYDESVTQWERIRDCMKGEARIKELKERYLPRPAGMSGEYAGAYTDYLERAHFPLITAYALSGALGVIITKLPEFNLPKHLEYLNEEATKDGNTLQQLFLDMIIEVLQTGKVVIVVDIVPETNQFKFVKYNAENFTNWKAETIGSQKNLKLAVLKESIPEGVDIFAHDYEDVYRVLHLDEKGKYTSRLFGEKGEYVDFFAQPNLKGKKIDQIPLFVAGSINNSVGQQPIPLLAVANCSIQIYRKEADLANSEFLSCNPTLVLSGASTDDNVPNVVGSSVMITLPDPAARVYYTKTDTAALTHVKTHIDDLYEEAIRHGVSILDTRKGVEAAEALRIRQATQSASIYSVYLSVLNALKQGLELMCIWSGKDKNEVVVDAPPALTFGIPDSAVLKEIISGFGSGVVPLPVIHRYLVNSGLIDQRVSLKEYIEQLEKYKEYMKISSAMQGLTVTGKVRDDADDKSSSGKPKPGDGKSPDGKGSEE